jgi:hypothetical protein
MSKTVGPGTHAAAGTRDLTYTGLVDTDGAIRCAMVNRGIPA